MGDYVSTFAACIKQDNVYPASLLVFSPSEPNSGICVVTDRNLYAYGTGDPKEEVFLFSEPDGKNLYLNSLRIAWWSVHRTLMTLRLLLQSAAKSEFNEKGLNEKLSGSPNYVQRALSKTGINTFMYSLKSTDQSVAFHTRRGWSSVVQIPKKPGQQIICKAGSFLAGVFDLAAKQGPQDIGIGLKLTPGVAAGLLSQFGIYVQTITLAPHIEEGIILLESEGYTSTIELMPGDSVEIDGSALLGVLAKPDGCRIEFKAHDKGERTKGFIAKEILGRLKITADDPVTVIIQSNPHQKQALVFSAFKSLGKLIPGR